MNYSDLVEHYKLKPTDLAQHAVLKMAVARSRVAGHATRTKDRLFKKAPRLSGTKGLR